MSPPQSSAHVLALEALRELMVATEHSKRRIALRHGINAVDISALTHLDANDDVAQVELARHLRMNPSSVTTLVDRLEAKKLVARGSHPVDRRRTLIRITARGRKTSEQLHTSHEAAVNTLPEEHAAVAAETLRRVARQLTAANQPKASTDASRTDS